MISVIKVGGALIDSAPARAALMRYLAPLSAHSSVVLVHGSGAQATALARRMGHVPRMVNGRRVTTDLDLDIHLWIAVGELNARLLGAAFASGIDAVGLNGASGGMVEVSRRPPRVINGETVDFGWVGDVVRLDPAPCLRLLAANVMPIVAPLGVDRSGALYNVNADSVAARLALALGAQKLLFVAESGGLKTSGAADAVRIPEVDRAQFEGGTEAGWIRDGMIAKLENAFAARKEGVEQVFICAPEDVANPERGTRVI